MNTPLTRRHFLRSSSSCIALPFLASLGFRGFASAASLPSRPKRIVFIGFGWGVTYESWYPSAVLLEEGTVGRATLRQAQSSHASKFAHDEMRTMIRPTFSVVICGAVSRMTLQPSSHA